MGVSPGLKKGPFPLAHRILEPKYIPLIDKGLGWGKGEAEDHNVGWGLEYGDRGSGNQRHSGWARATRGGMLCLGIQAPQQ
jgi:hypothetical protein